MVRRVLLACLLCLGAAIPLSAQQYRVGAGSQVLFEPGCTNFVVNGVTYNNLISAINAMSLPVTNINVGSSGAVMTNTVVATTSPLFGGGALNTNLSLTFNGASNFNASGATNINASQLTTGTVSTSRLPLQAGRQAITSLVSSATITFPSVFTNTPTVNATLEHPTSAAVVLLNISSVSSNSFIADFSAVLPSTNYVVHWSAIP